MEKQQINKIKVLDDCILILFYSGEIRKLCKDDVLIPNNHHTEAIIKPEVWKTARTDGWSIYWTGYKVFGQPYAIFFETAYRLSHSLTKSNLLAYLSKNIRRLRYSDLVKTFEKVM